MKFIDPKSGKEVDKHPDPDGKPSSSNEEVTCDKCFTTFAIRAQTKRVGMYKGEQIKAEYFECPSCMKRYPYLWLTNETRKLRAKNKEIQKLYGALIKAGKPSEALMEKAKFNQNMQRYREIEKELKNRFSL
ncbi:hypothetical protein [Geomicrobium sp. JCM 19038]|uniref:hypothetical protein n=1 Tax=Geomicrobium sp. JCM 19038 TaxID=1460635 RepID=UPI00045F3A50|nr:hypothetical protein [Geomicrobium sp. JCM 19038]GAK08984.1 hypothetical protein JCM19038_2792 [Geomicrobium sp. JCM 19038]